MSTEQRSLTKLFVISLVLFYPFGVLLSFAVNYLVKTQLGVEVDWKDEMVTSLYGAAITLVSCVLLCLGVWGVLNRLTRRCADRERT